MENQDSQNPSILIPKIDVSEPAQPVQEVVAKKPNKVLLGVLIFIALFLVYNLVAGFLVYSSGNKLAKSLKNLSAAADTQDLTKLKVELKTNCQRKNYSSLQIL